MWQFLLIGALAAGVLFCAAGWTRSARSLARLEARHAETVSQLRFKSGGTVLWGGSAGKVLNYSLASLDAGSTWMALEPATDGGRRVLGTAEQIYPGLLAHIEWMDALTSKVQSSGPLDLASPQTTVLLERSGFTVSHVNGQ
jgi:hypothetical protein